MRQPSELPEEIPAYTWDTQQVASFCVLVMVPALFLLGALLYIPGFSSLLFIVAGLVTAFFWWPRASGRYRNWLELRSFKKSIPDSVGEDNEYE